MRTRQVSKANVLRNYQEPTQIIHNTNLAKEQ